MDHETHDQIPTKAEADSFYSDFFDIDVFEYLAEENVLIVGGGTGFGHCFDTPALNVLIDPLVGEFDIYSGNSEANMVIAVGERVPFQSRTFDITICNNVLDHSYEPKKALREICRLLKPSGTLVFSINIFRGPKIVRDNLEVVDTPHPYHFSANEILQMLKDSGFRIEDTKYKEYRPEITDYQRWVGTKLFGMKRMNVIARKKAD